MSLSSEQQLFTKDISLLISYANMLSVDLTFGEAFRTKKQQELYLVSGKSKTMESNHLKRLAVDFNFFIDGKLFYQHEKINLLGAYWESLSNKNRWGGNFKSIKDTPHFERNL